MGIISCADVNQHIARHEVRGIPNMDAARDRLRPHARRTKFAIRCAHCIMIMLTETHAEAASSNVATARERSALETPRLTTVAILEAAALKSSAGSLLPSLARNNSLRVGVKYSPVSSTPPHSPRPTEPSRTPYARMAVRNTGATPKSSPWADEESATPAGIQQPSMRVSSKGKLFPTDSSKTSGSGSEATASTATSPSLNLVAKPEDGANVHGWPSLAELLGSTAMPEQVYTSPKLSSLSLSKPERSAVDLAAVDPAAVDFRLPKLAALESAAVAARLLESSASKNSSTPSPSSTPPLPTQQVVTATEMGAAVRCCVIPRPNVLALS